jgi:polysaccharide export outer membrane protein
MITMEDKRNPELARVRRSRNLDTVAVRQDARRVAAGHISLSIVLVMALATSGCFGGAPVQTQVVAKPADSADVGPYKIGRDDVLDVLVWKQQQLSGRIRVASDGTIMLPLIGQLRAAGLTTNELQTDLAARFGRYVHEPNVTVRVYDPASRVFFVLGEVTKPGMYKLMSDEVLSQALAAAGGPTEYANLRKIKIVRRSDDQQIEMTVNYNEVRGGDLRADVALARGDTITVP